MKIIIIVTVILTMSAIMFSSAKDTAEKMKSNRAAQLEEIFNE